MHMCTEDTCSCYRWFDMRSSVPPTTGTQAQSLAIGSLLPERASWSGFLGWQDARKQKQKCIGPKCRRGKS